MLSLYIVIINKIVEFYIFSDYLNVIKTPQNSCPEV